MSTAELELYVSEARKARFIFEFGCGGSTMLAVELGTPRIFSVESDRTWIHRLLNFNQAEKAVTDGRLSIQHVDIGPINEWGYPADDSARQKWPAYSNAVVLCEDFPDIFLIDGRFRVACAARVRTVISSKAKLIFHDYRSRSHYHAIETLYEVVEETEDLSVLIPRQGIDPSEIDAIATKYCYDPA